VASDSEHFDRVERTRQRRKARIKRFEEWQREVRRWINFADIAGHYTEEGQSILSIDLLARALIADEFEENGRSLVLFLHPTLPPTRLTPEWIEQLKGVLDKDWGRSYLEYCWIPRRLFERWRDQNRLLSSPYFEPINEPSLVRLKKQPKRRGTGAKTWAVAEARDQLWPGGIPPEGLTAKERDTRIINWMKSKGCSLPSRRTIQRVFEKRRT
jgi:hypothetical protein